MSIQLDKNPLLLLRCDGLGQCSEGVVAIVEGMLKTVIYDYTDIMADGIAESWMDESYATKAHEALERLNPDGVAEDAVEAAAIEAENLMSKIMTQNHHTLETMSSGWLVDEVAVLRRMPNLWVVKVFGSRFPY